MIKINITAALACACFLTGFVTACGDNQPSGSETKSIIRAAIKVKPFTARFRVVEENLVSAAAPAGRLHFFCGEVARFGGDRDNYVMKDTPLQVTRENGGVLKIVNTKEENLTAKTYSWTNGCHVDIWLDYPAGSAANGQTRKESKVYVHETHAGWFSNVTSYVVDNTENGVLTMAHFKLDSAAGAGDKCAIATTYENAKGESRGFTNVVSNVDYPCASLE